MTLGFTTIINEKPNFFVEKIWQSIFETADADHNDTYSEYRLRYISAFGRPWDTIQADTIQPKHHTVRRDIHKRWRAGSDIHFVVNNRSADRFQFAPTLTCKAVQQVEMNKERREIIIDGRMLNENEMLLFAVNDGFEDVEGLFDYFDKPFKGRLVHWTDLTY